MMSRAIAIAEAFGLAVVAAIFLPLTSGTWFISPDSIDYVEGAMSLVRGGSYLYADGTPITFFPVGTSVIYALAAAIPSRDYWFFSLLAKLLAIAYIALGYLLIRRHAGRAAAAVAALAMAVSPTLLGESTRLLSDIPYSVLLTLTLLLFDDAALHRLTMRGALGLALLVASSVLVRTVGIAVFCAYLAYIVTTVRRQRWRTAGVVIAVTGAAMGLHALRIARLGGSSYGGVLFLRVPWMVDSGAPTWRDWVARISGNASELLRDLARIWGLDWSTAPLAIAVVLLTLLGAATLGLRRRPHLLAWFAAFHVGAVLLNVSSPRHLLPLMPVLALFMDAGARTLAVFLPPRPRRAAAALALTAIAVTVALRGSGDVRAWRRQVNRVRESPIAYRNHEGYIDLIRQHRSTLATTDVVATNHAAILRYFLAPDTVVRDLPIMQDADAAYRLIVAGAATYLVCDKREPLIWNSTLAAIRTHPAEFEVIAETDDAAIYRREVR